jgi:uncharacterized protein with LGFP repeats
MFRFLRRFQRPCQTHRPRTGAARSCRLRIEQLEGRLVPSTISAVSWQSQGVTHAALYGIGPDSNSGNAALVNVDGGGFVDLGGYVKALSAGLDANGNPEVYGIGADNAVYVNNGTGWVDLGGSAKALSATAGGAVYVIGSNNSVSVNAGGSGFVNLGGYALAISAGLDANGNPEVYAIGSDHALYVNHGAGWVDLGGYVQAISASTQNTVYAIGSDNAVYVNFGGGFADLGGYAREISAGLDANGNPEVYAMGLDYALYVNNGTGYVDLGGYVQDIAAPAVGVCLPGNVAYGIGADGASYLSQGGVYTDLGYIADPIQAKYLALGGAQGILGSALTPEQPLSNGGASETFQNGVILWSPATGAHDLYGAVAVKYNALGGAAGYGMPTTDEASVPDVPGALVSYFENGGPYTADIVWSAATGAHTVYGAIGAEYAATANETGGDGSVVQADLGAPTSDEMNVPGVAGARMNTFQGGAIYWSPNSGAHVVYGGIGAEYNALGGAAGYGLPTTDEANVPGVRGVRVTYFENGGPYTAAIFWSAATGAHTVYGAIGAEYAATANETGYYGTSVPAQLGAPTSDEMNVPGVAGARMNTFQGGDIYWSPGTGAHVVYGGIGSLYSSMGGPTSYLGLPTADEAGIPGGRVSYFQNGKIVWTPQGGAYAVQTVSQMSFSTGNFNFGSGLFDPSVQGKAQLTVYADGSYNFTGDFHDSGALSYNDSFVFGLVSTSGVLYTFSHTGSVAGWTQFWDSSDDSWDVSGTNPALAAGWTDLEGAQSYWKADVSWDVGSLIQEIKDAAGIVETIISIV